MGVDIGRESHIPASELARRKVVMQMEPCFTLH